MSITDETIEAACEAFYNDPSGLTSWDRVTKVSPDMADRYRAAMSRALKTAAPHLLMAAPQIRAQALEEAAEFVTSPRAKTTDANLARASAVQEWLRRRAATYRTTK